MKFNPNNLYFATAYHGPSDEDRVTLGYPGLGEATVPQWIVSKIHSMAVSPDPVVRSKIPTSAIDLAKFVVSELKKGEYVEFEEVSEAVTLNEV